MTDPAKRVYNSSLLDSGRWNGFTIRPDDIVVATR
jgi:hypothetical protein